MDHLQQAQEASSSTFDVAVAAKAAGLFGIFSAGVLGAVVIAAVDPPKTRREMFMRALAAGVGSLFFGPVAVRVLDHYTDWVNLATAPTQEVIELVAPVYLVVGCLSWGLFGAIAMLSKILKARGAQALAKRLGVETDTTEN